MEKPHRRSLLQTQILVSLGKQHASSIVSLARNLGSSRPAVSRSLKALADQGFVRRDGRAWSITDEGREEAAVAIDKLEDTTADVVEVAGRRFRALQRAGRDDAVASTMASLFETGLGVTALDIATPMRALLHQISPISKFAMAQSEFFNAATSLEAIQTGAMDFGELKTALGVEYGIGSLSKAAWTAGFDMSNRIAELTAGVQSPLLDMSFAAEMLDRSSSIQSAQEILSITEQFGLSLAEQMATPIGAALKIREDQLALAQSIGAITAHLDEWPDAFTKAASSLADWTEQIADAVASTHGLNTTKIAEVLDDFARTSVPEPLYSDSLRAFGLNSRRIHSPTYPLASVQPIETVEGANQRALKPFGGAIPTRQMRSRASRPRYGR
jgi:DNA-binding MarR family transcriptional regulator